MRLFIHFHQGLDDLANRAFFSGRSQRPCLQEKQRRLDLAFICTVSDLSTIRAGDDAESYIFVPLQEIRLNEIGLDSIRKIVSAYADSRSKK